jgi:putative SOS response-associated peptidase YedK
VAALGSFPVVCGRFVASRPVEDIVEQFEVDDVRVPTELLPGSRFNVSPQDEVLAVRAVVRRPLEGAGDPAMQLGADGDAGCGGGLERRLGAYRWGLVPSWAKDPAVGARAFNARAETLGSKPMFRSALVKRRCIVPADGFYEWQRLGAAGGIGDRRSAEGAVRRASRSGPKQPWCFRAADGAMLGFAALYEVWRESRDSEWLATCTIITTEANDLMSPIHDRMPVVLRPEEYASWLEPGELEPDELRVLLAPPPDDFLVCHRVGGEVGRSRSEGPQLAEPVENSG